MAPRWTRVLRGPSFTAVALAALLALGCGRQRSGNGEAALAPATPGAASDTGGEVQTPGIALDAQHTVGPPIIDGNLAVFPIYARQMEDIGEFLAFDVALEKGIAVVREVGSGDGRAPDSRGAHAAHRGDGAQVNTLEIENTGDLPILVLAGTVVKGGKQDRQIGQDFIIGKKQTVPVEAFCVEHGRWNQVRNGAATGGTFQSVRTLAAGSVRQAGQYDQDQGQVWSRVGQINKATGNETASDTLTASLESPEAQADRARLGRKVRAYFAAVPMAERTVGLAYAVGGEVQGARFFLHHKLFAQYEETLVNTAVLESFTARAAARTQGKPDAPGACAPQKVAEFVAGAERGKKSQRQTAADNVNDYQLGEEVYSSEARMKAPAAAGTASPAAAPKAVTKDYLRKK